MNLRLKYLDTHAHCNLSAFESDNLEVIQQALKQGIGVINVGVDLETSRQAIWLAEQFESGVYAAVGLHPDNIYGHLPGGIEGRLVGHKFLNEKFDIEEYRQLALHPKVVAIGEVGLDLHHFPLPEEIKKNPTNPDYYIMALELSLQKEVLLKFFDLARDLRLPVILHCRDAYDDLWQLLEQYNKHRGFDLHGVLHSFSGNWEQAKHFLNANFLISFPALLPLIYSTQTVSNIPLNKILLESCCPYQSLATTRNTPQAVVEVAKTIAKIKNIPEEEVAMVSYLNALNLFKKIRLF